MSARKKTKNENNTIRFPVKRQIRKDLFKTKHH